MITKWIESDESNSAHLKRGQRPISSVFIVIGDERFTCVEWGFLIWAVNPWYKSLWLSKLCRIDQEKKEGKIVRKIKGFGPRRDRGKIDQRVTNSFITYW